MIEVSSLLVQEKRVSKRQYFEVVVDVLEYCFDFKSQSYMVYKANLRFTFASKLFPDLEKRGLLEKQVLQKNRRVSPHALSDNPRKYSRYLYRRTVKGSEFLRLWKLLMKNWVCFMKIPEAKK